MAEPNKGHIHPRHHYCGSNCPMFRPRDFDPLPPRVGSVGEELTGYINRTGQLATRLRKLEAALEEIEALDRRGHDSLVMADAGYIARKALADLREHE
jgi:hypothetical protein